MSSKEEKVDSSPISAQIRHIVESGRQFKGLIGDDDESEVNLVESLKKE